MKKILIINNDFDAMELLKKWLERKQYEVKYTGNKEEVTQMLNDFKPQLVMIDSEQKQIAEDIKKEAADLCVPVLYITGYSLKQKTNSIPGADVIEKPFNLSLLERKIKMLMEKESVV